MTEQKARKLVESLTAEQKQLLEQLLKKITK